MRLFKHSCFTFALALGCLYPASAEAEQVVLHTPESFQVISLSPNGKWACGVYQDATLTTYGFRWNLEGGSIEMLSATHPSIAWDISNTGIVAGTFADTEVMPNNAPIEMPGYYDRGQWHHVEMPKGKLADGVGYGISPDGQFLCGSINLDGIYTPFIWKNGRIHRNLDTGQHAMVYGVSADGEMACGYSTQKNRTACFWPAEGDVVFFEDSKMTQSPFNVAKCFTSDGKYVLYWGGWLPNDDNTEIELYCIYDVQTGERLKVKAPTFDSDLEFFDISCNLTMVGEESARGYVYSNGEGMYIDEYLKKRGVNLDDFEDFYSGTEYPSSHLPIQRVVSIAEDDSALAILYYNKNGYMASMVVFPDKDSSTACPAEFNAYAMSGLNTSCLEWKRPLGASGIRGYNIYRNGTKINGNLPLTSLRYFDKNLDTGTYSYEVATVFGSGTEIKSNPIDVEINPAAALASPMHLHARQKGLNSIAADWSAPMSNMTNLRYYNPQMKSEDLTGFAVYMPITMEGAIKFEKDILAQYAGKNIREVSFYPMGMHNSWILKFYTTDASGNLQFLQAYPIVQSLNYRQRNTIVLPKPMPIPEGDLYVAIEVEINPSTQTALGAENGRSKPGLTDLIRQSTEPEFYSAFDTSTEGGMSFTAISWAIDLGLAADDEQILELSHYAVYLDDTPIDNTQSTSFIFPNMDEGQHTIALEAVYGDNDASQRTSIPVDVKNRYPGVTEINLSPVEDSPTAFKAVWQAPVDNDRTVVSYTTAEGVSRGIKNSLDNGMGVMMAHSYNADMFRGMDGYKIEAFRFFPIADAMYTFVLYRNNDFIYQLEFDDYQKMQWNEIRLTEDIFIEHGYDYRLILEITDSRADDAIIAVDDMPSFPYYSDLFSTDGGYNWLSLSSETGVNANFLLGITVADTEGEPLQVEGYDVYLDNAKINADIIPDTEFIYDMQSDSNRRHALQVDTHYPALEEVVAGEATWFYLAQVSLPETMVTSIKLHVGKNYLAVNSEQCTKIEVYSLNGTLMACANSGNVEISALAPGIYIARYIIDNKEYSTKLMIE